MGLVVTDIDCVIEYNGKSVFKWFMDKVCDDRRRADIDPDFKVIGETSKLKGNSGYGASIMDRSKHTMVSFTEEKNISKHISNPFFKTMEELSSGVYEVEKLKKKVLLDLPIQIGVAVYSYAKLRLIQFWEFINKFLMNDHYQLMEMDTDSLYIAFAKNNIDDCVKPELKEQWLHEKWDWFSSEDSTTMIEFHGKQIPFSQWDYRTPGKFKPEFVGDGMVCLNSKVYHIWGHDKNGKVITKTSCKGAQQKRNEIMKSHFLNVLQTHQPEHVTNAGFIKDGSVIKTYTQKKKGLGYFYAKRKVQDDGVSTTHLDI